MKNGTAGNSIKQMFLMCLLTALIVGCLAATAGAQDFYSDFQDHYTHFPFTVSTDCEVFVTVSMASGATGRIIPSIVDQGQTIATYSDGVWKETWWMESENGITEGPIPLKAGTYALRVESLASHTVSTEVKTTLQVVDGAGDYGEYNDMVASATTALIGYTYSATIGYKGIETQTYGYAAPWLDDSDYWVISPTSDTTLTCTIDFTNVETDNNYSQSYLTAGVYIKQGFSNLGSEVISKPEKIILGPYNVTAGTEYVILVKGKYNAYGAYDMTVDLDASGSNPPSTSPVVSSTWTVGGIEWQQADQKNPSAAITQDSSGALTLAGAAWTNGKTDTSGYGDGNGVQTVSTYNFLGKTVRLKFKANGPAGKYLSAVPHVTGLPSFTTSTDHSWSGSTVIPDDVWVYVRYTFESEGSYDLAMATGNYDDQGGTLLSQDSGFLTSSQMADAKDTVLKMVYGDNYGGTASSLVLADAAIEDPSDDVTVPQACAVTIDQNLNFTIPNAIYDAGPLAGQMELKIDFQFFGEQNGLLLWQLGNVDTSPPSTACSLSIASDLSFTLSDAVYDAGPLVGQTTLEADFQYFGEKNGDLLWVLADVQMDNTPSDPPSVPIGGCSIFQISWANYTQMKTNGSQSLADINALIGCDGVFHEDNGTYTYYRWYLDGTDAYIQGGFFNQNGGLYDVSIVGISSEDGYPYCSFAPNWPDCNPMK